MSAGGVSRIVVVLVSAAIVGGCYPVNNKQLRPLSDEAGAPPTASTPYSYPNCTTPIRGRRSVPSWYSRSRAAGPVRLRRSPTVCCESSKALRSAADDRCWTKLTLSPRFPAAALRQGTMDLSPKEFFDQFPGKVLHRKLELGIGLRLLAPWNWPRLLSPYFARSDQPRSTTTTPSSRAVRLRRCGGAPSSSSTPPTSAAARSSRSFRITSLGSARTCLHSTSRVPSPRHRPSQLFSRH